MAAGSMMYLIQGNATLSSCTVRDCTAAGDSQSKGGAVYISQSAATFSDCSFERCAVRSAQQGAHGGALANFVSLTTLNGCILISCVVQQTSTWQALGGAAYNSGGILTLSDSSIRSCSVVSANSPRGGAM
eukprot:2108053-Prymnesium_polylepis.1